MCDMTHLCICVCAGHGWHKNAYYDTVKREAFIPVTWLIQTRWYVWHDSSMYLRMRRSRVAQRCVLRQSKTCGIHTCHRTRLDSLICVTWLIHVSAYLQVTDGTTMRTTTPSSERGMAAPRFRVPTQSSQFPPPCCQCCLKCSNCRYVGSENLLSFLSHYTDKTIAHPTYCLIQLQVCRESEFDDFPLTLYSKDSLTHYIQLSP